MKKLFSISLLTFLLSGFINSQVADPVKWKFDYKNNSDNSIELNFTATIQSKWHMYGSYFPEGGPIATTFHFDSSKNFKLAGNIIEVSPPEKKKHPNFDNMEITMHNGNAIFAQKIISKTAESYTIKGYVEYMTCNDQTCLPPKQKQFSISITPKISENKTQKIVSTEQIDSAESKATISPKPTID